MMSMNTLGFVNVEKMVFETIYKRFGYHEINEFNYVKCFERANQMAEFNDQCTITEYVNFVVNQYEDLREQEPTL